MRLLLGWFLFSLLFSTTGFTGLGQSNSQNCDPSFLIGEWSGEMKQYSFNIYATYPVVMRIRSVEGCSFKGEIVYPAQHSGHTTVKGQISGDSIFWTEDRVMQGENIVLNGLFLVRFEDRNELAGKWYTPEAMQEGGSFYLRKEWKAIELPLAETPPPTIEPTAPSPEVATPPSTKVELDRPVTTAPNAIPVFQSDITLYLWDSKTEDGDVISLMFNGEWIVKKHPLTKDKQGFPIQIKAGEVNKLVLYAEDMGNSPPTTASISFFDGKQEREFYLRSDLENCGAVRFVLSR